MGGIYWLASYPKSGNTWFRAFLTNLRVDGEQPAPIDELSGAGMIGARGWLDERLGFDTADLSPAEAERLRPAVYRWVGREDATIGYHKIHDAYTLTVDGEPLVSREATLGALYILRNPLDVACSFASFFSCSIDAAIDRLADPALALHHRRSAGGAHVRQRLLSWSAHVRSWVDAPGLNLALIRYEDMLADPLSTFTRAARFLHLPHDQVRVQKAIDFSRFGELSRQEAARGFRERPHFAPRFFRQGRSGGWRAQLRAAQVLRIIADHGALMRRFGYLDAAGEPL
ncbi:sulfotransferase domain-containing protein [uncultured Thiodictyon sp.]|uniref:sulfotransferase domain-containing protein n=1 Tax=uncultured Thiodictyon sp. TaxID=1846217 RepID=UPI0025F86F50|nr:sulfotransferase domain-containing protein [uncultured Thiodictyon sp.]